uniref:Uncharacterized protein n=1 Tax=Arundo donax TaxID=35708 RepID=A0A0A9A7M2_ARUDO
MHDHLGQTRVNALSCDVEALASYALD